MQIFVAMVVCAVLSGCGTKAVYAPAPNAEKVNPEGKFSIGEIVDTSGFVFPADEKDPFSLTDAMRDALKSELEKKNVLGTPGDYILNGNITYYLPGNAFIRWLAPGAGRTELRTAWRVTDINGKELATIPVNSYVAAGGGYTIGAWKYVFSNVAEVLIKTLQNEDKRQGGPAPPPRPQ
jgi:hypothetical protein